MSNNIMIRTLKAGAFTAALSLSTLTMTQTAQASWWNPFSWWDAPKVCSFSPDTAVLMGDGSFRPIASLRVGDLVASRSPETRLDSIRPVINRYSSLHQDKVILQLVQTDGTVETIKTTMEHPFHVINKGFIPAGQLKPGMRLSSHHANLPAHLQLMSGKGQPEGLEVKQVNVQEKGANFRAHNLTIAKDHTFFVGQSRAWVHNDCEKSARELAKKADSNRRKYIGSSASATIAAIYDKGATKYIASGWAKIGLDDFDRQLDLMQQLDPRTTNDWAINLGYKYTDTKANKKYEGFRPKKALDKRAWWGGKYAGTHNASHAEIQTLFNFHSDFSTGKKKAIGFAKRSRTHTMCSSCQEFLKFYTGKYGVKIIIASPTHTYVYNKGILEP